MEFVELEDGTFQCLKCKKCYSKYGIKSHIWRSHGEGIEHSPTKGVEPWNKGLNKENSPSLVRARTVPGSLTA